MIFKEQSENICNVEKDQKDFLSSSHQKEYSAFWCFFSYDPIFGTLFDQLFPAISIQFLAKDLNVMSSGSPVQKDQTSAWLFDRIYILHDEEWYVWI